MSTTGQDQIEAPGTIPPVSAQRPNRVRRLYREERQAWGRHYRRYFKYAARALGLGFVAGFLFFMLWPAQEKRALDFVVKSLKDIRMDEPPLGMAVTLFYHNARASVVAVAAGALPFLFLPIFDPILNGGVLGLLVSISRHQGLNVPLLILTQILPHGVFELAAVLYATSVGLYLSEGMGKKAVAAWKERKRSRLGEPAPAPVPEDFLGTYPERGESVTGSLSRNVVRSFVLVVLPLLLVAAFIEGFITPLLG